MVLRLYFVPISLTGSGMSRVPPDSGTITKKFELGEEYGARVLVHRNGRLRPRTALTGLGRGAEERELPGLLQPPLRDDLAADRLAHLEQALAREPVIRTRPPR